MDFSSHDSSRKPTASHGHRPQPSTADLLASAKVMAEATQAAMHNEASKIDKGRAADAAADLLSAASHYGKLEDKSFGKYIDQAESYLHQYHTTHSSAGHSAQPHRPSSHSGGGGTHSEGEWAQPPRPSSHSGGGGTHSEGEWEQPSRPPSHSGGGGTHSESGGFEEYFKMAEGFLKKY